MLGDGGGEGRGGGEMEKGRGGGGERDPVCMTHSNTWLVLLVWMLPRKGSGAAGSSRIKCLVNISMVTSVTNQIVSLP